MSDDRVGRACVVAVAIAAMAASVTLGHAGPARASASTVVKARTAGLVIFRRGRAEPRIYGMRPDGSHVHLISRSRHGRGSDGSPRIATHANRIVFVRDARVDGQLVVFTARRNGASRRRIAGHACSDAAISPNGRRVAFLRSRRGRCALWVMRRNGTHRRQLTGAEAVYSPSFSPDATQIIFQHKTESQDSIQRIDVDGSDRQILFSQPGATVGRPRYSPDGKQIVFGCFPPLRRSSICIMEADGSNERVLAAGAGRRPGVMDTFDDITATPAFSPAGDKIVYDCRVERICVMRADGSHRRIIGKGSAPDWG
jgi:dipeptidyl aminopeptidase/acylaminoacyl peptidase